MLAGRHTGENINASFTNCLKRFGIYNKTKFIITDNAANMKRAFSAQLLVDDDVDDNVEETANVDNEDLWEDVNELEQEVEALTQGKLRLSCFAHTLQLVICDGLKVCIEYKYMTI